MKLDRKLLLDVAKNSRLDLSEDEIKDLLPQLKEVLDVFSTLQEVDTTRIEPSFHPIKLENVTREDVLGKCFDKKEVFIDVKNKEKDYFKGPKAV
jgi:aspartyl-tRNA(Asn)/glutamyl-tRNA(Gln) amidotransferase subunit C